MSTEQRELSPCPNKPLCGSCGWSHIPYERQLQQKLSDINGSFKLHNVSVLCEKIMPSPKTSHYRNRMDFVIDFEGRVGLRQKGKWWRVIDDHPCFLGDEPLQDLFSRCRQWIREDAELTFYDRKKFTGFLRYVVIRVTRSGERMVILVTSRPEGGELQRIEEFACELDCEHLVWSQVHSTSDVSIGDELVVLRGAGYLEENIGECFFRITPNAFFQTNSYASSLLLDSVVDKTAKACPERVLDLYCGSGFFSIPLASRGIPIVGVEIVEAAIHDARHNAVRNGVQAEFVAAKSEDYPWEQCGADCVIVDPPRSGMHDLALKRLLSFAPETLVYVSCNYKQLAREMIQLLELYGVESIEAIDMFPHTPHVETVVHLKKK